MSKKQNNKQKKGQPGPELELVVQQQKRQILQQSFTIRQLQDRISRMTEENHDIVSNRDEYQKKYQDKVDKQRIYIQSHESTIQRLTQRVTNLEMIKVQLQSAIRKLQKQLEFSEETRVRQMEEYKRLVASQMGVLQGQLREYNSYMNERNQLFNERNKLKSDLQSEKKDRIRDLADKERQKVQQTDKLKDEMLLKIRDMRTNLLSLKKEQLSTTTRLAVLQNHQLTNQLQFQSKQTQKLLFQNESLQKKLSNMQKDVEIHKEVEEQLAKRSHISKGIIKKLTTKIAQLQDEIKKHKEQNDINNKEITKKQMMNEAKKDEMIIVLDKSLQEKDKLIVKLQSDLQLMGEENKNFKTKVKEIEKRSYQVSAILIKYYQDMIQDKLELKVNQNQKDEYLLDIRLLNKKPVKDWTTQQCKLIVSLLLNQIKPYMSKKTLGIPSINKSQIVVLNQDDNNNISKLPLIANISDHSLIKNDIKKFKDIPSALAPKFVGSNLRQWGRTVHSSSVSNITKKYK